MFYIIKYIFFECIYILLDKYQNILVEKDCYYSKDLKQNVSLDMYIFFVMIEYVDLYDIFLFQNKVDRLVSNGFFFIFKVYVSVIVIVIIKIYKEIQ